MTWLRDNSSTLNLAASLLLVAVTWVYVRLTGRLSTSAAEQLREAHRARRDSRMPIVTARATANRSGSARFRVEVEVHNWGGLPAKIYLDCPGDWDPPFAAEPGDPATVYATLPPGEAISLTYEAPVDPTSTREQDLSLDLIVAPVEGGASDHFSWTVSYDPSLDRLRQRVHPYFEHERRRYPDAGSRM